MTGPKPLAVSQRQVTAILKGAARAGVKLEIKAVDGAVYFNVINDDQPNNEQHPRREPNFDPPPRKRPNFAI